MSLLYIFLGAMITLGAIVVAFRHWEDSLWDQEDTIPMTNERRRIIIELERNR